MLQKSCTGNHALPRPNTAQAAPTNMHALPAYVIPYGSQMGWERQSNPPSMCTGTYGMLEGFRSCRLAVVATRPVAAAASPKLAAAPLGPRAVPRAPSP